MISGPEVKPRSGNSPKKLVFLFHGIGANGRNLIDIASVMNRFIPDTHFISPNAPHDYDSGMGGYQWFSRQDRSIDKAVEGLKNTEDLIEEFTNHHLNRFELTDKDLAVIGFSQGTMVALHNFLRRSNPVAMIAGFSGALLGGSELLRREIKSKPPVLLLHGTDDDMLTIDYMYSAEKTLNDCGVPVEAIEYPNLAHSIGKEGFDYAVEKIKQAFKMD